jgi:predicted lipid-binding transport protein (Tim44 family)
MPDIDLPTVIFALVALFVAYKLRSVLGMRNDQGRPPGGLLAPLRRAPGPASPAVAPRDAPVEAPAPRPALPMAPDRWKTVAEPDAWRGLDAIAAADNSFDAQAFLSGARAAYDMVIHAFAAGDSATLRSLMAPESFANFDAAIRARAAAGHTMTTTVVSIDDATIAGAQRDGPNAQISVRFASKLASVTRDMGGAVVDGSPTEVVDHLDLWTFVRDVRSRDPNWRLTATQSERP